MVSPAVCQLEFATFKRQKNSWFLNACTSFPASMAKSKGKHSSGADASSPDVGVPVNVSNSGTDNSPKLEENAFAGLRQKIEQKLKDEDAAKQKSKKKGKDTSNNSEKKGKVAPRKPAPKEESNKAKGQKRDRNGDVIAREEKSAGKGKESKPHNGSENDILRQEILALGGTQEDFDMLVGVGSESEVEDAAPKKSNKKSDEDSLRKELSSMLASAGQIAPGDLEEIEDHTSEEDEDEDEDAEEDDQHSDGDRDLEEDISDVEEETPPPPVQVGKSPKQSKKEMARESSAAEPKNTLPKEYSKLVCIPQSFSNAHLTD